jgi:hypothetical protein
MPNSDVTKILTKFIESALNDDLPEAWEETVHKGRENGDVSQYVTDLRAIFDQLAFSLDPKDPEIIKDEIVPFPNGPKRHFIQLDVSLSIDGVQGGPWKGIAPTGRQVTIPDRISMIIVDGKISRFDAQYGQHLRIEQALKAEWQAFQAEEDERLKQQADADLAQYQANAALRVAMMDRNRGKTPGPPKVPGGPPAPPSPKSGAAAVALPKPGDDDPRK